MKPSLTASALLLSFLGVLFCIRWVDFPKARVTVMVLAGVSGVGMMISGWMKRKRRLRRGNEQFLSILSSSLSSLPFILAGTSAALLVGSLAITNPTQRSIEHFAIDEPVTITGQIVRHPDKRPMKTHYTVEVTSITDRAGETKPVEGRILAIDRNGWPEFVLGENVTVRGKLEKPWDDGTFAYDKYLSIDGVTALMDYAYLTSHGIGERNEISVALGRIRDTIETRINRIFPEPHASLLAGLLTGSRRGIPEHLSEAFAITGLTHIIAISGYNITIITAVISSLLFWLPIKWRVIPAIVMIALFTLFVGAGPPVVRAAIMGSLGLLAILLNRQSHTRLLILWSAAFMSIWNPRLLWYDAGFQLSFAAVIGLNELSPLMARIFKRVPSAFGIRTGLEATMAAQIATLPLIIILFRRISLIAPLANIIVAPLVPLAMLFGSLGVVLSYAYFPLGQLVSYVTWGFLQMIILTAALLAKIPFASITL